MIQKISEITKNSILQKSVYNLPDRPSEMGMNPTEIKKAFYKLHFLFKLVYLCIRQLQKTFFCAKNLLLSKSFFIRMDFYD